MFKGGKSLVFWVGLLIVGVAAISLFWSVWYPLVIYTNYPWSTYSAWKNYVPMMFAGVVFLVIGFYMMKSGVKQTPNSN